MKATARYISMSRNITAIIDMASFPAETSRISCQPRVLSTGRKRNGIPLISLSGKKPRQNISCTGPLPGAKVSRGGISNAPR